MIRRIAIMLGAATLLLMLSVVAGVAWQGRQVPDKSAAFVALGSSFAAGIGLGDRAPGSPFICMRSQMGYPARAARLIGLAFADRSCSGSTTTHVLAGGQAFQPAQIEAVGPETRLVTVTSGGNDVGYIGDLMSASGSFGRIGKWLAGVPDAPEARNYPLVTANLTRIVESVRARAPAARVVLVTYPALVPEAGNCPALLVDDRQVAISREVAARLRAATVLAAQQTGAMLVDAAAASANHDACSANPWVNGGAAAEGAPFHPNAAGAEAIAKLVVGAVSEAGTAAG